MKTVFSANRQVAHVWAAQTQAHARAGNIYFEGPTIYSYGTHYPIATFTDKRDEDGEPIVLFNSRQSSPTTESKHKSAVRGALHGLRVRIIGVPNPTVGDVEGEDNTDHKRNLKDIVERYEADLGRASRARIHAGMCLQSAAALKRDADTYALTYGLPGPNLPEPDSEQFAAVSDKARAARQAAWKAGMEREEIKRREHAADIACWLRGGADSLPYDYSGPTQLRLTHDGRRIQTSRGAEVERGVAPRLWKMARGTRARGGGYDLRDPRVGQFRLKQIHEDGALTIGCHKIEFAELQRFAKVLGLPDYVEPAEAA